jgi:ribonucleoside-diphosphate reductase alpha chain
MSNLCTEIFQMQTTSKINDYGTEDEIGYDICCNLGSLNIANVMQSENIEQIVEYSMRALTSVANRASIKNAPGVTKANEDYKSVGLGAMNLHGFLAKNNIAYESEEAQEFTSSFFALINYYSIKTSNKIAIETKKKFKNFEKSDYANGKYFDKYLEKEFIPTSDKIKELFKNVEFPTKKD